MTKQSNQSITTMQAGDEFIFPDKSVYPLPGAKAKEKIEHRLGNMQPFRKYTPIPPVSSQQTRLISTDNADPRRTHRGKKIVRPTISAMLPEQSHARISPSSSKPKSGPVQLSLGFQSPAISVQTYDKKVCIDSDALQPKVSKIRSKQGDKETQRPQSLPEVRHPGNSRTSHAIAARIASIKRHESEEKKGTVLSEVCKDVEGLPPRHELIMREGQWRPVSSAQHRKPKDPSMEERNGRETKKGMKKAFCWCTLTWARGLYVSPTQCLYPEGHLRFPPTEHLHRGENRIQHQRRCLLLSTGLQFKSKVALAKRKPEVKRDV